MYSDACTSSNTVIRDSSNAVTSSSPTRSSCKCSTHAAAKAAKSSSALYLFLSFCLLSARAAHYIQPRLKGLDVWTLRPAHPLTYVRDHAECQRAPFLFGSPHTITYGTHMHPPIHSLSVLTSAVTILSLGSFVVTVQVTQAPWQQSACLPFAILQR